MLLTEAAVNNRDDEMLVRRGILQSSDSQMRLKGASKIVIFKLICLLLLQAHYDIRKNRILSLLQLHSVVQVCYRQTNFSEILTIK